MKKFRSLVVIYILSLLYLSFISCSHDEVSKHFAPTSDSTWTFMIYLAADNNLDGYDDLDIEDIKKGLSASQNPNMNVIILQDKSGSDDSSMHLANYNTYEQIHDGGTISGLSGGEINTGDSDVLSDFMGYCKTNYSADHYALIIWNHGGGSRGKGEEDTDMKAIAWDETSGDDCLYMDEVQQAISSNFSSSDKLDVIGFDACLMGTVEIAYEMKDLAEYMIASMANEWVYGWDYERLFSKMTMDDESRTDTEYLVKLGVSTYRDSTKAYSNQTMSGVDLSKVDSLKTFLDTFAATLYKEGSQSLIESTRDASISFYGTTSYRVYYPYYDLGDFAERIYSSPLYSSSLRSAASDLLTALGNTVVLSYGGPYYGGYYGSGSSTHKGLSIFFSYSESDYSYQWWYTSTDTVSEYGSDYLYGKLDFCTFDNDGTVENWKELMEAWYDSGSSNNSDTW